MGTFTVNSGDLKLTENTMVQIVTSMAPAADTRLTELAWNGEDGDVGMDLLLLLLLMIMMITCI